MKRPAAVPPRKAVSGRNRSQTIIRNTDSREVLMGMGFPKNRAYVVCVCVCEFVHVSLSLCVCVSMYYMCVQVHACVCVPTCALGIPVVYIMYAHMHCVMVLH